jgi:hypothetical protein
MPNFQFKFKIECIIKLKTVKLIESDSVNWNRMKKEYIYFIEPRIVKNVETTFMDDGGTMTFQRRENS